ncbi:MAG: sigma-54-dependent Fis family transcriptional regulator [Nitrospirae bacterium]|nr:MAG: sigma-54-dependent Fis family transcriptional regulator [Nitrospirota bacterium]
MATKTDIRCLLVEDDENLTFVLSNLLKEFSIKTYPSETLSQARQFLENEDPDLVILDLGLPDGDGSGLIEEIRSHLPDTAILIITGRDDATTAVNSLKMGVIDYIVKPFDLNELRKTINRIILKILARRDVLSEQDSEGPLLIGQSRQIKMINREIHRIADYPLPVLITGQTGTGKELVARAIHKASTVFKGPFVKVDCGVLSPTIIESELFGYEKGAFTDAKTSKAGLVEIANGGVLFFDEITNLPYELQSKLLQLIEEKRFRRVGGLKEIEVNLRIIAATNEKIEDLIKKGSFREDLYWRLNAITLNLPPLRERREDILCLAYYFLEKYCRQIKKTLKGFNDEAEKLLLIHPWPGNVRQLRNAVERAVIYCKGQWVGPEDLALTNTTAQKQDSFQIKPLSEIERDYIKRVLEVTKGNKTKAARLLGISRTTLREKIKTLHL